MVAELRNGTALWTFDTPRLDTVVGECNMIGEQKAATPTASGAQAIPFTVEQQGFLEEFISVQHHNHEAAIHELQASHAEEIRMIRQEAEDARRVEHMRSSWISRWASQTSGILTRRPFLEWGSQV